jgi:Mitochondrial ribosomal protein (VAR1)
MIIKYHIYKKIKNMTNYNNNLKNSDLNKITNVSVNSANKNISNKDYKKNLLKLSNKKQISIFIEGLNVINKHLNKVILNWPSNKNSIIGNITKTKFLNRKNNRNLLIKKINNYFPNIKNLEVKKLLIKNLILRKKETDKSKVSISSIINNNLMPNPRIVLPLRTIKSKNSTFINNLSNYKLLIQFNKINNNYNSLNTIRNYIKNITNFNSKSAYSFSNNYNYKFNSSTTANNKLTKNLYTFLESSFYSMYCLISKPIFIITPDKVVIHIFFYSFFYYKILIHNKFNNKILRYKNNSSIFKYKKNILKLKIISQLLACYFKKPVVFELTKLKSPYFNANILVKLLGFIINKTKLRIIKTNILSGAKIIKTNTFLNDNNSPSLTHLAGIKVRVAGRLLTQRVVPRKTVKVFNKGKLARGKVIYLETARFTNKNKRGAFSVTIFIGHIK